MINIRVNNVECNDRLLIIDQRGTDGGAIILINDDGVEKEFSNIRDDIQCQVNINTDETCFTKIDELVKQYLDVYAERKEFEEENKELRERNEKLTTNYIKLCNLLFKNNKEVDGHELLI